MTLIDADYFWLSEFLWGFKHPFVIPSAARNLGSSGILSELVYLQINKLLEAKVSLWEQVPPRAGIWFGWTRFLAALGMTNGCDLTI